MDALLRRRSMIAAGGGSPTPPTPILPTGYTQLTYIENPANASAYFLTGLAQSNAIGFSIDFMSYDNQGNTAGQYGCIFGSRQSSNTKDYQLSSYTATSTPSWKGSIRLGDSGRNYDAHLPAKNTRFVASLSGTTYTIDGNQYTVSLGTLSTYIIAVFALNENNGTIKQNSHGRLYSLKFYNNGTLVRDYVPCINPNNVVGVYDLVNNTFTGSANSTAFVAGPAV